MKWAKNYPTGINPMGFFIMTNKTRIISYENKLYLKFLFELLLHTQKEFQI
jgi:hypothetical protein